VVVTHHEVSIRWNGDVADCGAERLPMCPVFPQSHTVDVDGVALRGHVVTGHTDDPLHQISDGVVAVLGDILRGFEDNDVTDIDRAKVHAHFVHHDSITDKKSGLH